MRLLIHGINFAPELVGVGKYTGEMAEWLALRGHEVRVVTAPPFNPEWKVGDGYSAWRYSREDWFAPAAVRVFKGASGFEKGGAQPDELLDETKQETNQEKTGAGSLRIERCPLWVPPQPSGFRRLLHLASFALASLPSLLRNIFWHPGVVMAVEPTLFCLPGAILCARGCHAKLWLHVQDFEADAAFELGLLRSGKLRNLVMGLERRLLSAFDRVSTISPKMLEKMEQNKMRQKESSRHACLLFPNWVDTDTIFPLRQPSPLRAELGISEERVVALYAGTMGHKQGLENMAEVVRQFKGREDLCFVFCGEGPGKSKFVALAGESDQVRWLPLQPFDRLNELLNLADIHLLPQKAGAADLVMPSKLTGMLASGRPVVATSPKGTQLAHAVEGRGIVVDPEDTLAFCQAIERLACSPRLRHELGRNAREYALCEFEKEVVLSRFERQLIELSKS